MSYLPSRHTIFTLIRFLPLALPLSAIGLGIAATLLLILGQFRIWLLIPLGIGMLAGMLWLGYRAGLVDRAKKVDWRIDLAVLVGAIVWCAVNLPFATQHLLTDRDPATYAVAGLWLMKHPNLHITVAKSFSAIANVNPTSLGFGKSLLHPNELYAQGSHFLPALLGFGGRLVGRAAVFHGNIIFGGLALLAFYSFARIVIRQRWAALATLVLAVSLPFIYFSRDSYTEPLTLMCVFGALAVLRYGLLSKAYGAWFLAGLCIGTEALIRPDAYTSIAAIEVFLLVWLLTTKAALRLRAAQLVALLIIPAEALMLLGWIDLTTLSSGYYHDLRSQILAQLSVIIAVAVVAVPLMAVGWRAKILPWLRTQLYDIRTRQIVVVVLSLCFLFLLARALLLFVFAALGREHTISVQTYSNETTLLWLLWYIGPVATIAGISMFIYSWQRILQGKSLSYAPLLLVLTADCLLYLTNPRISPDQIWASRRFLPVIFPGFILLGTAAIRSMYRWTMHFSYAKRLIAKRCLLVVVMCLVLLPAMTSFPFWTTQAFAEESQIEDICHIVPPKSVVLWVGHEGAFTTEPTVTLCDAASFSTSATGTSLQSTISRIAHVANGQHRQLFVGTDTDEASLLPHTAAQPQTTTVTYTEPEHTYKKFPIHTIQHTSSVVLVRIST